MLLDVYTIQGKNSNHFSLTQNMWILTGILAVYVFPFLFLAEMILITLAICIIEST